MHAQSLSHVWLFVTPWTVAQQAPLSMGFFRQEYWSGLPFSPPWDLPDPGIKLASPVSPALAGGFFITTTTWEAQKLLVPTCDLHRQWSWTLTAHQNHLENVYRISMAGSYLAESCWSGLEWAPTSDISQCSRTLCNWGEKGWGRPCVHRVK